MILFFEQFWWRNKQIISFCALQISHQYWKIITQNAKYRIISNKTVKFSIRGKNGAFFNFSGRRGVKTGKCPEKEAKSNPWVVVE